MYIHIYIYIYKYVYTHICIYVYQRGASQVGSAEFTELATDLQRNYFIHNSYTDDSKYFLYCTFLFNNAHTHTYILYMTYSLLKELFHI